MVGAVEQKLRPACNGAEFAYPEPLMVYRIMVKHVVTLKLARVVNEVVVYSVVAHFNRRVGHYGVEVHRLGVTFAWIYFLHHDVF